MTTDPVKVLCVVDYYFPGFKGGGPLRTIANMRPLLAGEIELAVFTRDRDLGADTPYDGFPADCWIQTATGPMYYASPDMFGVRGLQHALKGRTIDLLYLNSFFGPHSSIRPYLWSRRALPGLPILLAPRGEFSPGALALKKTKKRAYLTLVRALGLYRDVQWHASSEAEKVDILRQFPKATVVHLAEDPVRLEDNPPAPAELGPNRDGTLRIVFISRISPMKNLDGLLRILATLSRPISLDIYGPIEDRAYWASCEALIAKLPPHIRVSWKDELKPDAVSPVFGTYDLFAFPTLGENFGHVIFEALRAGTPVLISDRTPWTTDASGAVTTVALNDTETWRTQLHKAADRTDGEKARLRYAARSFAEDYARRSGTLARNLAMFKAASGDGYGRAAQPPQS
jgi:glycosyltransferase involved in cell wall biosynthesis